MYPSAEPLPHGELAGDQNKEGLAASLNSVPPTQMLYGVEQRPLTPAAPAPELCQYPAHPAAPLSPAAATTVIPCAAACCHNALMNCLPAAPWSCSHIA